MSAGLELRDAASCGFDVVTLGEVMLRFDPGEGRIRTARTFAVSEGGGEYNVGRALRRTYGHRVATVTAVGDSEVGRLLEDLLLQGGTALDHVVWKPTDDLGRQHRTPLNFTERGFGVRPAQGVSDRAHSAASAMQPDDVDWDAIFTTVGARWFHTGGIFAGLSASTRATVRTAIAAARRNGTVVSYDVNYRPSLWRAAGGADAHRRLTEELAQDVDVLFGVGADAVGDWLPSNGSASSRPKLVAATRRTAHSASVHDWSGVVAGVTGDRTDGTSYEGLAILDRVGGGDAFAAGVIHGLLAGRSVSDALEYGLAHGALVMTTTGDTSSADVRDVEHLVRNNGYVIDR